ncbi:MAG: hypothetical protein CM1200mP1_05050 [Candidatus Neomarinimicrobiota bacterium]|nr:MAG: hypothetical protein CM1200mP1_05050 [Candidatus Neomarinimicrobiota bacterium]
MYNFFGYFILVYLIVFGLIILWFAIQFRAENHLLKKTSNLKE